ncbi:dicarboxylate/amino acid:cation symporter [Alkalitalea saponilacus]|uniref:Sodium:dicarboxylate symporter family protein n=1 Tax=Alkalitalea saponilacus TaxID=889453 RepID=A0A1T5H2W1_9BACT|nr:dicarboxylate/amino acid:cation symporter [Alkalitalea saponilacus]ASB50908.1 dicarboxylate/amino acid:cation symporter [Alkalitalea saponilacus]SKC15033.1 Sodium:dicarboxylate symporter family protein [Alkalitalea saponilacus]
MTKKIPLYIQIIIGLIAGIVWAVLSGYLGWSGFTASWIAPFGRIFINLLQLIAVPLVFFSIIGGIIRLGNPKNLGKLGGKTMGLYVLTTLFSISLGLLIVNVFKPGNGFEENARVENRINYELWLQSEGMTPMDGRWMMNNPAYNEILDEVAQRRGYEDIEAVRARLDVARKAAERGPLTFLEEVVPSNLFSAMGDNRNMLQIIFFAIFFGVSVLFITDHKKVIIVDVMDAIADAFIKMVDLVMRGAPLFVFALMAGLVSDMAGDDPARVFDLFAGLTWYSLSVLGGLLIMAFVVYPGLMALLVKNMTFREFLRGISPAQMLAFSTSSSAATLPVTLECVEENLKVDKKVTSFVLPIGATINMDGTSLYQAVAVVFLAQMHLVELSFAQQLTIVMTTTLASIGAAAIPGAGIVMLMVVLTSVGLNPAWIAIILPVDRILDMVRTMVNVTGDATISVVVGKTVNLNDVEPS